MERFVAKSPLGSLIVSHRDQILAAAEALDLENVRVFGSVSRGDDDDSSDVDLLVHRRPGSRGLNVIQLEEEAESVLGVSVDVLSDTGLGVHSRDEILATAVRL